MLRLFHRIRPSTRLLLWPLLAFMLVEAFFLVTAPWNFVSREDAMKAERFARESNQRLEAEMKKNPKLRAEIEAREKIDKETWDRHKFGF